MSSTRSPQQLVDQMRMLKQIEKNPKYQTQENKEMFQRMTNSAMMVYYYVSLVNEMNRIMDIVQNDWSMKGCQELGMSTANAAFQACGVVHFTHRTFDKPSPPAVDRATQLHSYGKVGYSMARVPAITARFGRALKDVSPKELVDAVTELVDACGQVATHVQVCDTFVVWPDKDHPKGPDHDHFKEVAELMREVADEIRKRGGDRVRQKIDPDGKLREKRLELAEKRKEIAEKIAPLVEGVKEVAQAATAQLEEAAQPGGPLAEAYDAVAGVPGASLQGPYPFNERPADAGPGQDAPGSDVGGKDAGPGGAGAPGGPADPTQHPPPRMKSDSSIGQSNRTIATLDENLDRTEPSVADPGGKAMPKETGRRPPLKKPPQLGARSGYDGNISELVDNLRSHSGRSADGGQQVPPPLPSQHAPHPGVHDDGRPRTPGGKSPGRPNVKVQASDEASNASDRMVGPQRPSQSLDHKNVPHLDSIEQGMVVDAARDPNRNFQARRFSETTTTTALDDDVSGRRGRYAQDWPYQCLPQLEDFFSPSFLGQNSPNVKLKLFTDFFQPKKPIALLIINARDEPQIASRIKIRSKSELRNLIVLLDPSSSCRVLMI